MTGNILVTLLFTTAEHAALRTMELEGICREYRWSLLNALRMAFCLWYRDWVLYSVSVPFE